MAMKWYLKLAYFVLFVVALVFIATLVSCSKVVTRDARVYKAELEFFDAASDEVVERGKALIARKCKCGEVSGVSGFIDAECRELAETVLVLESRVKYHTDLMRYLGSLSEERPPADPPEIQGPDSLCGE